MKSLMLLLSITELSSITQLLCISLLYRDARCLTLGSGTRQRTSLFAANEVSGESKRKNR